MIPIHEVLHRIRWDQEFGQGYFEVGYDDHVAQREVRVPFARIEFEAGNHFAFQWATPEGEMRTIPLHRVRAVYKDGVAIWQKNIIS
jgi:uncharacterized protein (UPF0248 family)